MATFQNNHIFTYNGSSYLIHATGTKCLTAVTTLDHLGSKKFQDTGAHVPQPLIDYLKQEGTRELRVAKDRKMRRVVDTTKEKKKKQKVLDYQYQKITGPVNPMDLYRKIERGGDVKYDCSACEMLVAPHGFLSHVAFTQHKERLRSLGKTEDTAFIEREKAFCQESERKTAGSYHCDACDKWVTPQCWLAHAIGKTHFSKLGYSDCGQWNALLGMHEVPKLLDSFKEDAAIPYFAVGEDMWDMTHPYFSASTGVLEGFQVLMCVSDYNNWGTQSHPGLVASLQADPTAVAHGVIYKVDRATMESFVKAKSTSEIGLAAIPIKTAKGKTYRALGFINRNISKVLPKQAAQRIATAFGGKGSNYSLVMRIVHEYEKQGWVDDYFLQLQQDCEDVLWPKNTRGTGGVLF
eukprot:TRINITY_DN2778_c0_g1_i4.p1 TRINITY_DN2778_c0_g1~~TRINITY_DN2778_c0_g1_i4.p1  ORF type:complete len:407 (+),score=110.30 TRINITY_DN2778_c0_g1_i4:286-1506(+)